MGITSTYTSSSNFNGQAFAKGQQKFLNFSKIISKGLGVPRGLSREQAAWYIGVPEEHFDDMVYEGVMPQPKCNFHENVWDRCQVDLAFEELPYEYEVAFGDGEEA
jgi:hypothetical protein